MSKDAYYQTARGLQQEFGWSNEETAYAETMARNSQVQPVPSAFMAFVQMRRRDAELTRRADELAQLNSRPRVSPNLSAYERLKIANRRGQ